jgi:hypothetical protein
MATPYYILAATPVEQERLRQFFDTDGKVARLLEHPPETRYASFGLTTLDSAHLVKGEFLEVRSGNRKTIHLHPDGTLIFRAVANDEFLGWPLKEEEFLRQPLINPIVVCDTAVSFVRFYKALLPLFVTAPKNVRFRVELRNAVLGDKPLSLVAGGIQEAAWQFREQGNVVREPNPRAEVRATVEDVENKPDALAYQLVEQFYSFFDLSKDAIAYANDKDGTYVIDVELFDKR